MGKEIFNFYSSGKSLLGDEIFKYLYEQGVFMQMGIDDSRIEKFEDYHVTLSTFDALEFLILRSKYLEDLFDELSVKGRNYTSFEHSINRLYKEHKEYREPHNREHDLNEFQSIGQDDSRSFDVANLTQTVLVPYIFARNVVDAAKKGMTRAEWHKEWVQKENEIYTLAKETNTKLTPIHFSGGHWNSQFFREEGKDAFWRYRLWYVGDQHAYAEDEKVLITLRYRARRKRLHDKERSLDS